MSTHELIFKDWGLINYDKALSQQEALVSQRFNQQISDTIIFCSHPPVVTLGRSTQADDLVGWDGVTVEVSRGGRATYHGPGQRLIYPIIDLSMEARKYLRTKDIMSYLENFEQAVLDSLHDLGLSRVHLKEDISWDTQGRKLLNRGLWLNDQKIAAFGIAVRRWVTYHGCAINIRREEKAFAGIQPCGYTQNAVGYIEDHLDLEFSDINTKLDLLLQKHLIERFSWTI